MRRPGLRAAACCCCNVQEAFLQYQQEVETDDLGGDASADGTYMDLDIPVPEAIVKFRAVYKFHEGSSAAVRRGVKMSSLM